MACHGRRRWIGDVEVQRDVRTYVRTPRAGQWNVMGWDLRPGGSAPAGRRIGFTHLNHLCFAQAARARSPSGGVSLSPFGLLGGAPQIIALPGGDRRAARPNEDARARQQANNNQAKQAAPETTGATGAVRGRDGETGRSQRGSKSRYKPNSAPSLCGLVRRVEGDGDALLSTSRGVL